MTLTNELPSKELLDQLLAARAYKKWPIAKLISLFESALPEKQQQRHQLVKFMSENPTQFPKRSRVIGFTGTPGAGKSSLIAELCQTILATNPELSIAVLAVDPSSQVSGGSILGDRTRMHNGCKQSHLYFRSQASNLELGGIAQTTFQATRLLRYLFDFIFIETVGIGQSEIDIQHMSDQTYLVMQPLAGDQIQFMKCGIMEIPDCFVVNKCDEEVLARTSYYMLRSALKQARIVELDARDDFRKSAKDNIFLTSAHTGMGIPELANHIVSIENKQQWQNSEWFYLTKAITQDYGRFGLAILKKNPQIMRLADNDSLTFEEKSAMAQLSIQQSIL